MKLIIKVKIISLYLYCIDNVCHRHCQLLLLAALFVCSRWLLFMKLWTLAILCLYLTQVFSQPNVDIAMDFTLSFVACLSGSLFVKLLNTKVLKFIDYCGSAWTSKGAMLAHDLVVLRLGDSGLNVVVCCQFHGVLFVIRQRL